MAAATLIFFYMDDLLETVLNADEACQWLDLTLPNLQVARRKFW